MDKAFMEQMKKRVEKELQQKEIAVIQFWRQEVEKLLKKPSESLSALQLDLKKIVERMDNRLKILKKSSEF